ncbi:hypothetical protein [Rouxiella sp. Mn2063]|uniref:hypothetical protein n=1 Tax=Rouxiella sp. Mn2063 TaxID=3395262 RepID=UPI003BBB047A
MKFNDTSLPLPKPTSPAPWWANMAEDATLEGTALKRPVTGRANIVAILSKAITLYDYQEFIYRDYVSKDLFMESYRSTVNGVPVECAVLVHMNEQGQADALMINHHPLSAALLFSKLMWDMVGNSMGDLYLTADEAKSLAAVNPQLIPE